MKTVSLICPCYNEEDNIFEFYNRVSNTLKDIKSFEFEFIFIDNFSNDNTLDKLKQLSSRDKSVKVILNSRNFGQVRSPYWALMQSKADAAILISTDLQDPPEKIIDLVMAWDQGSKVVLARKIHSNTNAIMNYLRKFFYKFINSISEFDLINDANGFGIYDKSVIFELRKIADPYPYLRGLVCEIGGPVSTISYRQDIRTSGTSKSNISHLVDVFILAIVNTSFKPIRFIFFLGFLISTVLFWIFIIDLLLSICGFFDFNYLRLSIEFVGFLIGMLILCIGILGEYIVPILRHVRKKPIVVEKERINFN